MAITASLWSEQIDVSSVHVCMSPCVYINILILIELSNRIHVCEVSSVYVCMSPCVCACVCVSRTKGERQLLAAAVPCRCVCVTCAWIICHRWGQMCKMWVCVCVWRNAWVICACVRGAYKGSCCQLQTTTQKRKKREKIEIEVLLAALAREK